MHPTIAPWIFTAYRKTVTSQPKLYGKLYRSKYEKSLNRLTQMALHRICYFSTAEIIRQLKPDAIVCTHPFPNVVVSTEEVKTKLLSRGIPENHIEITGIPMLFYQPIPGQEEENLQYFTASGFGESIESAATFEQWFCKLAESCSDVQERRSRFSEQLGFTPSADYSSVIMELLR